MGRPAALLPPRTAARARLLFVALLVLLSSPAPRRVLAWNQGDIFIGRRNGVDVYSTGGLLQESIDLAVQCQGTGVVGGAFNADGSLLAVTCGLWVVVMLADGSNQIVSYFYATGYAYPATPNTGQPLIPVFDRDNNLLVSHLGEQPFVFRYNPRNGDLTGDSGTFVDGPPVKPLNVYTVPYDHQSTFIDVDRCGNLVYTSAYPASFNNNGFAGSGDIFSYSLNMQSPNPNFVSQFYSNPALAGQYHPFCYRVKALPDGSLLAACVFSVFHFSPSGELLGQFSAASDASQAYMESVSVLPDSNGNSMVVAFGNSPFSGTGGRVNIVPLAALASGIGTTISSTSFVTTGGSSMFVLGAVSALSGNCQVTQCTSGECCNVATKTFKGPTSQCSAATACAKAAFCSGTSTTCPTPAAQGPEFVCRSATACAKEVLCNGTSLACPEPEAQDTGFRCSPVTACSKGAVCDGAHLDCPEPEAQDTGFQCSPVTACSKGAVCDGAHLDCPAAAPQDAGFVCAPDPVNPCAVQQTCDGTNLTCPLLTLKDAGATCGPPTACSTKTCSSAGDCVTNYSAGTQCGAATACAQAAVCVDGNTDCPAPAPQPSTFMCRPATTCRNAAYCDNTNLNCPAPVYKTEVCSQAIGCAQAAFCVAGNPECPAPAPQPPGFLCAQTACSTSTCDGTTATVTCPAPKYYPAGTKCGTVDQCTDKTCDASGGCTGTTYLTSSCVLTDNPNTNLYTYGNCKKPANKGSCSTQCASGVCTLSPYTASLLKRKNDCCSIATGGPAGGAGGTTSCLCKK